MFNPRVLGYLRTLLVLGRVSNLPTIWSNCLAGWWLGGASNPGKLPLLILGASSLYTGGMFLNDAFDAQFDRKLRPTRPIPSGAIKLESVSRWGWAWLGFGTILLFLAGIVPGLFGAGLALLIVFYNAMHKQTAFSPALMAACRLVLYLLAASVTVQGVSGAAIWCGLALAAYIAGISLLARGESMNEAKSPWPCVLLAMPIGLALLMNASGYRAAAVLLSIILALWILRSLRPAFLSSVREISPTVAHLLAGIVWVDWLAVADAPRLSGVIFIPLFLLALLLQRYVPST